MEAQGSKWAFAMRNSIFAIRFLHHIKFVLDWFLWQLIKSTDEHYMLRIWSPCLDVDFIPVPG